MTDEKRTHAKEAGGGGRTRRLLRSRDDRMIAGVAGGLGTYLGVDPVIVRIAFVVSIFIGGLGIVAYIVAALFVPVDDGTGSPVAGLQGGGVGRAVGLGLLALIALCAFGALVTGVGFLAVGGKGGVAVAAIAVIVVGALLLVSRGGGGGPIVPAGETGSGPLPAERSSSAIAPLVQGAEVSAGPDGSDSRSGPGGGPVRRLLRSHDDRVIAGVAGGLGRYFDVDPVIVRIAFALTIFFGGLGVVAYLAAALFVPADDGTGSPAPSRRGRGLGRAIGIGVLVLVGIWVFGALVAGAAFLTGIGAGLGVVAAIVAIGVALVVLSFRGGAKWLIVPALALTIGVGVAAAADLDLSGGIGEREYRPASASAIPADGYELGVGRLAVDLRDIDWSPTRVLDLDLRVGAGEAVVAVPAGVCVEADAHAGAGELRIVGQRADGVDVDSTVSAGSTVTPRLRLSADADVGQITVISNDTTDISGGRNLDRPIRGDDGADRRANARACAG